MTLRERRGKILLMVSLRFAAVLSLASVAAAACGLRSDSAGPTICSMDNDTDAEIRHGSCMDPIDIPATPDIVVEGVLGGCSDATGWCGDDDGPEDVYRLVLSFDRDVTILLRPEETTFPATLRVTRGDPDVVDPCSQVAAETEVCAPDATSRSSWKFRASADTYYIAVDSASRTADMRYAFEIRYGYNEEYKTCTLHPEPIVLGTGGQFVWEDALPRGQGEIDSPCNAPGAEHIFEVQLKNAGVLKATVEALSDVEPVVSLRAGCVASTDKACGANEGGTATASAPVEGPGKVLVAVDQSSVTGGSYRLTLSM